MRMLDSIMSEYCLDTSTPLVNLLFFTLVLEDWLWKMLAQPIFQAIKNCSRCIEIPIP